MSFIIYTTTDLGELSHLLEGQLEGAVVKELSIEEGALAQKTFGLKYNPFLYIKKASESKRENIVKRLVAEGLFATVINEHGKIVEDYNGEGVIHYHPRIIRIVEPTQMDARVNP